MTLKIYINGVGVAGSGITGWKEAVPMFAGKDVYVPADYKYVEPDILPPNERRRSVKTVQLAIAVALEAVEHSGANMADLQTVFASSMGDGYVMDNLLRRLAMPHKVVSPIAFHNSVHNAAGGYWLIGAKCMKASTSITGKEATFGVALMESASQIVTETTQLLLVLYDIQSPEPLNQALPIKDLFAMGLVMSRERDEHSFAVMEFSVTPKDGQQPGEMDNTALETLRAGNPAGRSLPLLAAIAKGREEDVVIEYTKQALIHLHITPCG